MQHRALLEHDIHERPAVIVEKIRHRHFGDLTCSGLVRLWPDRDIGIRRKIQNRCHELRLLYLDFPDLFPVFIDFFVDRAVLAIKYPLDEKWR